MIEAPFEYAVPHARQAATVGAGAPLYFHIYFDILISLTIVPTEGIGSFVLSVIFISTFFHVAEALVAETRGRVLSSL